MLVMRGMTAEEARTLAISIMPVVSNSKNVSRLKKQEL
jgi:hypothetical protein